MSKSKLLLLLTLYLSCIKNPEPLPHLYQKGMSFAAWWHNAYLQPQACQSLRNLRETGTEWVSIIITWYQERKNSNVVHQDSLKTPSDTSVIYAINLAHGLGFKVMLKPHVDVQDGSWRGLISPQDPEAWFASYKDFILHYARMASRYRVEQFSIGCEFGSISRMTSRWREIIERIRGVYTGSLTYAANHDEYYNVAFWDELDYVGIDAYFPLTSDPDATLGDIMAGWRRWVDQIESWQAVVNKPVIFTEIGYCSQDGTNTRPWDWELSQTIDLEEQANCYEAVLQIFPQKPWFKGIFWWMWTANLRGGPDDRYFTPYGKPAEEVLKRHWR